MLLPAWESVMYSLCIVVRRLISSLYIYHICLTSSLFRLKFQNNLLGFEFVNDWFLNLNSLQVVKNTRKRHKVFLFRHFEFHRVVNVVSFRIHGHRNLFRCLPGEVWKVSWWAIFGENVLGMVSGIITQRFERRDMIFGKRNLIEIVSTVTILTDSLHRLVRQIFQNLC